MLKSLKQTESALNAIASSKANVRYFDQKIQAFADIYHDVNWWKFDFPRISVELPTGLSRNQVNKAASELLLQSHSDSLRFDKQFDFNRAKYFRLWDLLKETEFNMKESTYQLPKTGHADLTRDAVSGVASKSLQNLDKV